MNTNQLTETLDKVAGKTASMFEALEKRVTRLERREQEAAKPTNTETQRDEGWIPHTGTECPVHPKDEGEALLADGSTIKLFWVSNWGETWHDTRRVVAYKITKAYTPLKLIDWGMKGMEGCMTNYGKYLMLNEFHKHLYVVPNGGSRLLAFPLADIRLATPKDHECWQSALNFKAVDSVIKKLQTQCVVQVKNILHLRGEFYLYAFRIIGLAEGYTDDPSKAGV